MTDKHRFRILRFLRCVLFVIGEQWKGSEGGRGDVSRGNPVIFQKKGETTCMEH